MWKLWKRIVLTVISVLVIAFIFSNSIQNAEVSSAQSSTVTEQVETVVNNIVNGGEISRGEPGYITISSNVIRKLAHFVEFGLLGVSLALTYLSYGGTKRFYFIPIVVGVVVAICDECIQIFAEGRASQVRDVLIDVSGMLLGAIVVGIIAILVANRIKENKKVDIANQ